MKLLVTGGHNVASYEQVQAAIEEIARNNPYKTTISVIVSGRDRPPAMLAERWAQLNGVPVEVVQEDPTVPGAAVGYIRGVDMISAADMVLVIRSPGSQDGENILRIAALLLKPVYVYET